jgi:glutamine---fructose-6-phosphate transaminase (isomerizing)
MTTIFEQEISSQPALLRERQAASVNSATRIVENWRHCTHVLAAARGSSDNAALFFQYLAGQELGLLVALAAPSLYEGDTQVALEGASVVAISQSGRSPGISSVAQQALSQGRHVTVITNDSSSPLAQSASDVVELSVGKEHAIASTKTLTSTVQTLVHLVEAAKGETLERPGEFADVAQNVIDFALSSDFPLELLDADCVLSIVGRGLGYAVASEMSLKIREVSGVQSEAWAITDYVHGPIGAANERSTMLLVVTSEVSDELTDSLLAEAKKLAMKTVVLRSDDRAATSADGEIVMPAQRLNWLNAAGQMIIGQVLALRLGEKRGRPIDTAPGLNKVTTLA